MNQQNQAAPTSASFSRVVAALAAHGLEHLEIREFEPREALLAGGDGLDAIRALLAALDGEANAIGLEIGTAQAAEVTALARACASSLSSSTISGLGGLASPMSMTANIASMRASSLSVLASTPTDCANRRARSGLTMRT